jgi:radical SAM protein with 4Fe4S-binding SPASM domain
VFQQAVDEIGLYGVRRLTLHLHGEPLMHPQLFEMIAYAKTKEKIGRVEFSTNGSLLNEKNIRGAIDSGLDMINVCMDGATAETYENARRGLKFEKTVKNLIHLIEAVDRSERKQPHIFIQIIQTPAIVAEMDLFWQIWNPIIKGKDFVEVYLKKYEWWSGSKTDDVENNSSIGTPGPFYVRLPCAMLERQLNVYWNGDVTHCCVDWNGELQVGHFPEQSLMEIWQSAEAKKLRGLVRDGSYAKLALCSDCMRSSAKRFLSWEEFSKKGLKRLEKIFAR